MRGMSTRPAISGLTPLELRRKISVQEAAARNNVHESTFRRHYSHLIKRIGKRRQVVDLGDALTLPPPKGP
jgi:hypothetical protein